MLVRRRNLAERQFYGPDTGKFSLKKLAKKAVKTVKKIPGTSTALAPLKVVRNVARGQNVLKAVKAGAKETVSDTRKALPIAASVASFVPGIGTGVATGLGAAAALSEGKNLRQIAEEAAVSAIPGGRLIRAGVKAGIGVAKGQNVLKTLAREGLDVAKQVVPGGKMVGEAIESGVRAGYGIARGQNVARTLAEQGIRYARQAAPGGQYMQRALNVAERGIHGENLLKAATSEAINLARENIPGGELGQRAFNIAESGLRGGNMVQAAKREGISYATSAIKSQLPKALPMNLTRPSFGQPASLSPESVRAARTMVGRMRPQLRQPITAKGRKANFRPLAQNTRAMLVRALPHMRSEIAGLSSTGAQWLVETGDTGSKIAKALTGDANRWVELRKVNPKIMSRPAADIKKYGFPIYTGDVVNLPASWIKVTAQTPAQSAPATPSPAQPPPVVMPAGDLAAQGQARVVLAAWGKSDGLQEAGVPDYGSASELGATSWTARDVLQANSFANWWRRFGGAPAVADGNWSDELAQALNVWAQAKATLATNSAIAAGGVVVPPLPTITPAPATPAAPAAATPTPSIATPTIIVPSVTIAGSTPTATAPIPVPVAQVPAAGAQGQQQAAAAGKTEPMSDAAKWGLGSSIAGGILAAAIHAMG